MREKFYILSKPFKNFTTLILKSEYMPYLKLEYKNLLFYCTRNVGLHQRDQTDHTWWLHQLRFEFFSFINNYFGKKIEKHIYDIFLKFFRHNIEFLVEAFIK
jgi:hypothetical protein